MSIQPNRKQDCLAREAARRRGIPYQAALEQIRHSEGEEDIFLSVGRGLDADARLRAKLARVQTRLFPSVNAGRGAP